MGRESFREEIPPLSFLFLLHAGQSLKESFLQELAPIWKGNFVQESKQAVTILEAVTLPFSYLYFPMESDVKGKHLILPVRSSGQL